MFRVLRLLLPLVLMGVLILDQDEIGSASPAAGSRSNRHVEKGPEETEDRKSRTRGRGTSPKMRAERLLGKIDPLMVEPLEPREREELREFIQAAMRGGVSRWCWSEETRGAKLAAFVAAERLLSREHADLGIAPLANQFLIGGRWSETATERTGAGEQGDPIVVTWSVAPDGTPVPGTSGVANRGSDLQEWMGSLYGETPGGLVEEQPWFEVFREAFELMAETCGVILRYEPRDDGAGFAASAPGVLGVRGDIRLGARFLDGNSGLLGISLGPNRGEMVLDSGDSTFALTGGDSLRLVNVLSHELGHCLGLDHVCPVDRTKLMEPSLSTAFRGPQFDEFQSLQRLYGDRFERHEGWSDNDSPASATVLGLPVGELRSWTRLSIDGKEDLDFFRLEVLNGQRLQVELIPGEGRYAEGGESSSGCSGGTLFDSRAVQDLSLEMIDRNGVAILATADREGPGGVEELSSFEFPRSGRYFLKVSGGRTNAAQLYQLRLNLADRLPGARLILGDPVVVAESGSEKNGRPDPGETVRVQFPLENEGTLPSGALSVQVSGPGEMTIFESAVPEVLGAGEAGAVEVVFGIAGSCGEAVTLELRVGEVGGSGAGVSSRFQLGEILEPVPLAENFDRGRELPEGWTSGGSGGAPDWVAASTRSDTPLRSAFGGGNGTAGESWLISPPFELGLRGGVLGFRHSYRIEGGFDGGVLEISREGGAWVDAFTGYELGLQGGYDERIAADFGSSLAGREAWTGRENGFRTTSVRLPSAWAGEVLQFRWRFAHDRSGKSGGWWVDSVKVEMTVENCLAHRPALSLRPGGGSLDENWPSGEAVLILESELPLLNDLEVPLVLSGTADPDDYQVSPRVILPTGQRQVEVPVRVRKDDLIEGTENLVVAVPDNGEGFLAGPESRVVLEIRDRVNFETWLAESVGEPVDPAGDRDGDGWSEIAEYLLGTDPGEAKSSPGLGLVPREEGLLIPIGSLPERDDALLGVERSTDLIHWEALPFTLNDEGLLVVVGEDGAFLRLTFRLLR